MRVGVLEYASLYQTLPSKPDPTRRQQQRSHADDEVQSILSQAHKLPAQFTAFDEESNIMPFVWGANFTRQREKIMKFVTKDERAQGPG